MKKLNQNIKEKIGGVGVGCEVGSCLYFTFEK
jgi:hypothetical protein